MRRRVVSGMLAATVAIALFSGCGNAAEEASGQTQAQDVEEEAADVPEVDAGNDLTAELTLAAAASLENVFEDELIPLFHESYPYITVVGTYASSGDLQTQIENGLAADVFFSAATKQMNALDEAGYVDRSTRVDLLENKVVLIVPVSSTVDYITFEDIANAEMVAIGDPESVPAGQYAQEALINLGLWESVSAKASFGTKVTEVLAWVAEESADAGVVYATDAAAEPGVKVVAEAPEGSLETPVIYPVAVMTSGQYPNEAKVFVEFLQTDEAEAVFEKYGFAVNE